MSRTEAKTDLVATGQSVEVPEVIAQTESPVVPEAQSAQGQLSDLETLKLLDATIPQIANMGYDEQTQKRLTALFNCYDGIAGQELLPRLYSMQEYGRPVILSKDRVGNTLLDNLEQMSKTENLHSTLRDSGPAIVLNAVESILDPYTIYQGNKGTCVPSCMQFVLASENPAEYSRTILQLSENLQAKVNHSELKVTEEQVNQILEVDLGQNEGMKGIADKLIQTAIINHAVEPNERYDYKIDRIIATDESSNETRYGVRDDQMTEALSSILADDFESYVRVSEKQREDGQTPSQDKIRAVVNMQVSDGSYSLVQVDFDDLRNPSATPDSTRHLVVVTGIDGNKVRYFDPARNPDVSESGSKISPIRTANFDTFPVHDVYVRKSDASGLEELDRE